MTRRLARGIAPRFLPAALLAVTVGLGSPGAQAMARPGPARSDSLSPSALRSASGTRALSGPPLSSGAGAGGAAEEASGSSSQGEADPLVGNGLGSPLCKGALGGAVLPTASQSNCETSGFVAAPAPTGNYGIDVHIDTGVFGLGSGGLLSIVQDLFVTPLWMGLVWLAHAVVVMLEWCFTIDLLDSASAGGVGRGLRQMEAAVTEPWLAIVLAIASTLAIYDGVLRRRVAETVGRAIVMATMMVGGMWVIADPTGTVGALGQWANQASLGTLAVAANGAPAGAGGVLARSMTTVFAAAIEAPWCYLEFGDVAWCRDPARLDPRLRAAGLRIAARELSLISCTPAQELLSACTAAGSSHARALEHSARLLRNARTNGAIFLALPANGPDRNSINEQDSLLRTMCQSSAATNCRGPTAAQAEFRTNGGTWSRVGGLILIAVGVLGLMLLLGFIALRLLAAAIFSLLYLLLAPGVVLAPALGEAGRAVFRRWVTHLVGAVVSKLLFSFLLGVVLAVLAILSSLQALGWWTQWLLMSAFWWGAYLRRNQALGVAEGAFGREPASRPQSLARRVRNALDTPRQAAGAASWTKRKLTGTGPADEPPERPAPLGRARARARTDEQVRRTLEHDDRDARARLDAAPSIRAGLAAKRTQLERVRRERDRAGHAGDIRRAAELHHRGRRITEEIQRGQQRLEGAGEPAEGRRPGSRRSEAMYTREQRRERERYLDAQAALPAAAVAASGRSRGSRPSAERRDYPALAGLAGYGREEYERLPSGRRRAVRVEIDRELAMRRELSEPAKGVSAAGAGGIGRRRASPDPELDRLREHSTDGVPAIGSRRDGTSTWRPGDPAESSVMRDAREVAARRKRQLGSGRP
jgi:hypothetical protein